jgi:hypothetical protein
VTLMQGQHKNSGREQTAEANGGHNGTAMRLCSDVCPLKSPDLFTVQCVQMDRKSKALCTGSRS